MNRPYVICHMVTSLDGKVTGEFLSHPKGLAAAEVYYEYNRTLQADAFACGRITMESSFTGGCKPDLTPFADTEVPDGDYIAQKHSRYAVSFDRHGRVGWTAARLHDEDPGYDDCHIIEVLCEDTPPPYLAYLRSIGVSYLFAGKAEMDLPLALQKLRALFGIRRLLLEGGSILNGAFAREGLIDEISIVMAALTAGAEDKPLFEHGVMEEYALTKTDRNYQYDVMTLRFRRAENTYIAGCWCPRGSDCDMGMMCRNGVKCSLLEPVDVTDHDTCFRLNGGNAQFFRSREDVLEYLSVFGRKGNRMENEI